MQVLSVILARQASADAALRLALAAVDDLPMSVQGPTLARIEVPLTTDIDAETALAWLAPWPREARCFWADRDDVVTVAGVGEAWHVGGLGWTLDAGLTALQRTLASAPRRVRLVGGVCFHGELRSTGPWKAFGAWRFALPQLELGRDGLGAWLAVHVHGGETDWSERCQATRAAVQGWRGAARSPVPSPGTRPHVVAVRDTPDRAGWHDAIAAALTALRSGTLDKVVLARQRHVALAEPPDAVGLLGQLAARQPRSFRFCLQPRADSAFVGASPERLLRVSDGDVLSEALAGTRPRGADPASDAALADGLRTADKDRREHALVADMVASTLRRVCDDVTVASEPAIMALSHVQHLHTPIAGRLRPPHSVADLLVALHPTPAVGGTPRLAARALIAQLEAFQRGLYAAPVGWVGGGGDAEFTVAIRSALVEGSTVSLFSGAGVVLGSDADAEWAEIDGKIAALWQAFGLDGGPA